MDQAARHLQRRSDSERQRFLSRYGVDKMLLSNYDLVCDTTSATPEEVVARIVKSLEAPAVSLPAPACYLDPRRVRRVGTTNEDGEIVVRYQTPHFFIVRGHRRLDAAVHAGETLTSMVLVDDSGAAR